MTQVYLGIGSNLNREHNIPAGISALKNHFGEVRLSPVYESESIGFKGSLFFNLVAGVQTNLSIAQLSHALKKIEMDNGYLAVSSVAKFSPRTLDIDILTYGNFVGVEAGIELPRAEIIQNAFVLLPLSEVAPHELHPQLCKTYADLWSAYDKASQALWPVDLSFV